MSKEPYLDEDNDLIERLSELSPGGVTHLTKGEALSHLQILAFLRTRKTYKNASDTQDRFNWILIIFTLVQICIALFQFTLALFNPQDESTKFVVFGLSLIFIIILVWTGFREAKRIF